MDDGSIICKIEIAKQPVFPVPDWAFSIKVIDLLFNIKIKKTYLSDSILALDYRKNSFLLNRRWFDETVTIDSSEYSFLQTHIVKTFDRHIPVCVKLFLFYTYDVDMKD